MNPHEIRKKKAAKLQPSETKLWTKFELDICGIRSSVEHEETQTFTAGRLLFMASFI
jgi:hypothetical protein